jgi:diacylglycerol kinase (ATP)
VRIALAVNPTAGRGRGARAGELAVRSLAAAGVDVDLLRGDDAADLARRIADGLDRGSQALVVVGGDGIVNLGVNAVAGTTVPLGIVPAGTGNDLALGLGIPVGDPFRAVEQLRARLADGADGADDVSWRAVDAVRCTGGSVERWFAGVLGAGFDAIVNERAEGWRRPRGRSRYVLALARELPVFRPREYQLELDGERWATRAMLVAVANAPSYGGGMRVCPDARMDDGLLDVLVLEPISRAQFVRIFPRVYSGAHVGHPRVTIVRAGRVRVAADSVVGYADGERFGPLPLECVVVPGALRVLGPAQPPPGG